MAAHFTRPSINHPRGFFSGHTPEQKKVILLSSIATSSMVLGVISIAPIIPMLADIFQVSIYEASFVLIAYSMPGIIFAPLAGALADKYGRKAVLVPAFLLFSLAGFACALAPSLDMLIGLRFLQGIGAAPLGALNVTIIGDSYSGPLRARMIGYSMTLVSICNAVYPVMGGYLAQISWQLPFALPLLTTPVAYVAFKTPLLCPHKSISAREYLLQARQIFTPRTCALLCMTLVSFFLLFGILMSSFGSLAKVVFQARPGVIGSMLAMFSVGAGVISMLFGRLTIRFSSRRLIVASLVLYSAGIGIFPLMPSLSWLLVPLLLFGLGHGLNVPCMQSLLVKAVRPGQRGTLMSLNSMLTRIGQACGPFACSLLFEQIGPAVPFVVCAAIPLSLVYGTFACIPAHMPIESG